MMYHEQLIIIKRWTYRFEPGQTPDGKWHAVITYSTDQDGALPNRDRTAYRSLWHNMIDEAFTRVMINTKHVVKVIEGERDDN